MGKKTAAATLQRKTTAERSRARFLGELAKTGNVTQAAREAHVDRCRMHVLRNTDPDFAAAWEDALDRAADGLEQEAYRRAVLGWDEEVYTNAHGFVGTVHKYDSSLLALMLKAARPEKYRDNVQVTAPGNLGITVILEQMRVNPRISDAATEFVGLLESPGEAEE